MYKEAYRMPLSINQGVWGVYLLPEIQFRMISPLKRSPHWGRLSSGFTCMAMFAAFPSFPIQAAFGRLHNSGGPPSAVPHCCGIHDGGWEAAPVSRVPCPVYCVPYPMSAPKRRRWDANTCPAVAGFGRRGPTDHQPFCMVLQKPKQTYVAHHHLQTPLNEMSSSSGSVLKVLISVFRGSAAADYLY